MIARRAPTRTPARTPTGAGSRSCRRWRRRRVPQAVTVLRARLAWRRHRCHRCNGRRGTPPPTPTDPADSTTRSTDERGAATVLAVAMAGVLLLVGAATGVVGAIVVDHRRAQAAADLAALAAAAAHADPGRHPCTTAARVATANGATLRSCRRDGPDVVVTVVVQGPRWLGQEGDLIASARAGPDPARAGPDPAPAKAPAQVPSQVPP
ncbi:Rv3654c family TadE-like protein [Pimelobacter simplex]|uniref:Rv3654c family TadE-like protein n=1 Tax=Nocardioides simplex TaxID=2045 RepID=UPI00381A0292